MLLSNKIQASRAGHYASLRPSSLNLPTKRKQTTEGASSWRHDGHHFRSSTFIVRAQDEEETAFEKRLADLKRAKGETPYGEGKKKKAKLAEKSDTAVSEALYSDETVFYDGSPHTGDLAVNVLLGVTILWLPLTFAAIGRKAFVRYKITDKRISVATTAPWETRQTDVAYSQVQDVVAIGRGIGLWGDMVVTLKNGDKVEIRSLDKSDDTGLYNKDWNWCLCFRWQEIKDYITRKKAEAESPTVSDKGQATPTGF